MDNFKRNLGIYTLRMVLRRIGSSKYIKHTDVNQCYEWDLYFYTQFFLIYFIFRERAHEVVCDEAPFHLLCFYSWSKRLDFNWYRICVLNLSRETFFKRVQWLVVPHYLQALHIIFSKNTSFLHSLIKCYHYSTKFKFLMLQSSECNPLWLSLQVDNLKEGHAERTGI